MICIELFCGTKSFSKVAKELGHDTFTIDINPIFNPDLCIDILDFEIEMLPEKFRHPDIIWSSPPCTTFSVASIYRYWDNGKPKNEKTLEGLKIVEKTIKIIKDLDPKYYFIENPRGMLRKQDIMKNLPRKTITYCQYGHTVQKPTDIWTNLFWSTRPMCKPGSDCHEKASRGSKKGVQGINSHNYYDRKRNPIMRSIIPKDLFIEIFKVINNEI